MDMNPHQAIKIFITATILSSIWYDSDDIRKASGVNIGIIYNNTGDIKTLPSEEMSYGNDINNTLRILLDRIGVDSKSSYIKQNYTYSFISNQITYIDINFMILTSNIDIKNLNSNYNLFNIDKLVRNSDESEVSDFSTLENISISDDSKTRTISCLSHLYKECKVNDIVFELAGESFTINDLQSIYQFILGFEPPSFRRITIPKLDETGEIRQNKGFRPSKLFKAKERMKDGIQI